MAKKERIKFYSQSDLSSGSNLLLAESILRNFDESKKIDDINDIIELWEIKRYIDNDMFLKTWTKNDISIFKDKVIKFGNVIGRFFSLIDDSNVVQYFKFLDYKYRSSFWQIIEDQHIYKKIQNSKFLEILNELPNTIYNILRMKNIVTHFDNLLREFLLHYPDTTILLLNAYEIDNSLSPTMPKIFFPKSLTVEDKEGIIIDYLKGDNVNLNYTRVIENIRNRTDFCISDKTRLLAKKISERENKKILEEGTCTEYKCVVQFTDKIHKEKEVKYENNVLSVAYNSTNIKQCSDEMLLYNFWKLFGYLDWDARINLISKKSENDILNVLCMHPVHGYPLNHTFTTKGCVSGLEIRSYDFFLKENMGKNLEYIVRNFINVYLFKKYAIKNLNITMPAIKSSFLEKIRMLSSEMESLLKRYKLYVENGKIDLDLLQISSAPCGIGNIPSMVKNKYAYINEECLTALKVQRLFCSDQTNLYYVDPYKGKYYCLIDLLVKEKVKWDNYENYQKNGLQQLINEKYLSIDNEGYLKLGNIYEILILKDLYKNEFINVYDMPKYFQYAIKAMKDKDMLIFGNTLFSKQEQSYFNYYLNKSEFTNGLDLRNRYVHGTQADSSEENEHEKVYYIFLKFIILIIIKIDDDLRISKLIKCSV